MTYSTNHFPCNWGGGGGSCQYQQYGLNCYGEAAENGECPFGQSEHNGCCCTGETPIIVDILGNGFDFTSVSNGVPFDLDTNGVREHLSWTSIDSDDAWLVLDRNYNGLIDNGAELFGNRTPQPEPGEGEQWNGFRALAQFDLRSHGGNADGVIDKSDEIFSTLRLWKDVNHNGVSESQELYKLKELGLKSVDLDYKRSTRVDEYGNQYLWRAKVKDTKGAQLGRWAWDVVLASSR